MRHAILLPAVLFVIASAVASACGGSSSETPWPVEPEAIYVAPAGENTTPASITEERADGGKPKRP